MQTKNTLSVLAGVCLPCGPRKGAGVVMVSALLFGLDACKRGCSLFVLEHVNPSIKTPELSVTRGVYPTDSKLTPLLGGVDTRVIASPPTTREAGGGYSLCAFLRSTPSIGCVQILIFIKKLQSSGSPPSPSSPCSRCTDAHAPHPLASLVRLCVQQDAPRKECPR